jgi:hypothetical protein
MTRPERPRKIYEQRLQCTPKSHLLDCHNSWLQVTFCQCGNVRVPGEHKIWREQALYDHKGKGSTIQGWTRYTLGDCPCHPQGAYEVPTEWPQGTTVRTTTQPAQQLTFRTLPGGTVVVERSTGELESGDAT